MSSLFKLAVQAAKSLQLSDTKATLCFAAALKLAATAGTQVEDVGKEDVVCTARNSAELDGLLTVFHTERSADTLQNVQNDLPILTDYDKQVHLSLNARLDTCARCGRTSSFAGESQHVCTCKAARHPFPVMALVLAMPDTCPRLQALKAIMAHFEVDFVSLSFVREADDVHQAREFLDSLGHTTTKVRRMSLA